jgi:hypothetical protein
MSHSQREQASSNMWNPGQLYLHDCYRGVFYVLTLNAPNAFNKKSKEVQISHVKVLIFCLVFSILANNSFRNSS